MRSLTKFVMLGLLLLSFAAIVNMGSAFAETVEVAIELGSADANSGKSYDPKEVTVTPGTTVIWTNMDTAGHTVTSGDVKDASTWANLFDSGFPLMPPGATFEFKFDKVGEYPYFCQVHPWMTGKVIVKEAAPPPPPPPMPEPTPTPEPEEGTITVTHEGRSFDVMVTMSNGAVTAIDVDPDFTSVILTVEADGDGELLVTLPRALIDAKMNGADDQFIVLVDGDEVDYMEHHTSATERALSIEIPAGTTEVEIVGTWVVPEFPIAVMAVMGMIVATAIAVSRFRNPLKP
ncbi:MAG: plastocyanin/azurin family copper-binding protein [Nitrososphaerales archaeon]